MIDATALVLSLLRSAGAQVSLPEIDSRMTPGVSGICWCMYVLRSDPTDLIALALRGVFRGIGTAVPGVASSTRKNRGRRSWWLSLEHDDGRHWEYVV